LSWAVVAAAEEVLMQPGRQVVVVVVEAGYQPELRLLTSQHMLQR
jgi:hypothetical protein